MVTNEGQGPRTAAEFFNRAVDAFNRSRLADAVASLRLGFFENLYVAPLLLGERVQAQNVWHPSPQAEPEAAQEYVSRYRSLWDEAADARELLRRVWNDPLVRNELKAYLNLCKSLRKASGRQSDELLRERERFTNVDRIVRTQSEILRRVRTGAFAKPERRPLLGLVMLSSLDPKASVDFYRALFDVEPVRTRNVAGGYAEFEFEGLNVGIHGYNKHGHGDPYGLGPPPRSLGWGAFFVIRVTDLDRYYERALAGGIEIVDSDLSEKGSRFFVVKDPSGYVFEITEEELRGLSET